MTSLTLDDPRLRHTLDSRAGMFVPASEQHRAPGVGGVMRAAFEQENIGASALIAMGRVEPRQPPDPDFNIFAKADESKSFHPVTNPFTHLEGFEAFGIEFLDARNADDVEWIKTKIRRELNNRQILADAGFGGFAAMFAAAVMDPLIFIPGTGVIRGARGAASAARTALAFGGAGAGIIAVQEAALHATQETRTPFESAINITGGAILSGILGGAVGKLTTKQLSATVQSIDTAARALDGSADTRAIFVPHDPNSPQGRAMAAGEIPASRDRAAFEIARDLQPGDTFIAGRVGRVEVISRTGEKLLVRLEDGSISEGSIFTVEQGIREGRFIPDQVQGTRLTKGEKVIAAEPRDGPGITTAEIDLSAKFETEGPQPAKRVTKANDVAPLQKVRHPKYGDGEIIGAAQVGDKVARYTARGEALKAGRIVSVRLEKKPLSKPPVQVKIIKTFIRGKAGERTRALLVEDSSGTKHKLDLDAVEGVRKLPADKRLNTESAKVKVRFSGSVVRNVAADQLTTRSGFATEPVANLTAGLGKIMDGSVPDPVAPGGIDLSSIGPVRIPTEKPPPTPPAKPVPDVIDTLSKLQKGLLAAARLADAENPGKKFTMTAKHFGKVPTFRRTLKALETRGLIDEVNAQESIIRLTSKGRAPEAPPPPGERGLFGDVKAQDDGKMDSTTTAVELAEAGGVELEKANVFGLDFNVIAKFLNPRLQMVMSKLRLQRDTAARLIEIPGRFKGDRVHGASAELRMRVRRAEAEAVKLQIRELYLRYLTGDPNARMNMKRIIFGIRDRQAGKYTEDEFWQEVAKSLRGEAGPDGKAVNFDIHEVPEVQQAAILFRTKIINPVRDEMIEMGVLPPEIKDFPGYLTRLYDDDLLRRPGERELFVQAIIDHRIKLHLAEGNAIADFPVKAEQVKLNAVVNKLLAIPETRLFPGDTPLRGPLMARTLDVPDSILQRWLVNDGERILNYYTRSMIGDAEIIKRFGLWVEKANLESTRKAAVTSVRNTEGDASALVLRYKELLKRHGGVKFKKALNGRGEGPSRGIRQPKKLAKRIFNAKSDADAEKILKTHDENLMKEYSTGSMDLVLDRVRSQWKRKEKKAALTDKRQAVRIRKQRDNDLANLRLARDEIRGMAGLPRDPAAFWPRALRTARMWTVMAIGGKIALSSIPDLSLPLMNHAFADPRAFGKMFGQLISDFESLKLSTEDTRFAQGPGEQILNTRAAGLLSIEHDFLPKKRFERGVQIAVSKYSLANMMGPWNQVMRNYAAMVVMNFIIASARRVSAGEALTAVAKGRLAELGLDEAMLRRVFQQFEKHGGDGLERGGKKIDYAPNLQAWKEAEVRDVMINAVHRSYDLNVIKGGVLDRPKLAGRDRVPGLGDELSKTIFFFLNFGLAANTRILSRGLQFRDAAFMSGAALSVGLGAFAAYLKWKVGGSDRPPATNIAGWVKVGVEQSGISGFIFDADRVLEQATMGRFALSALFDSRGTRFYSPQTAYETIFGLPVGQVLHTTFAAAGFLDADPEPGDIIRLRRIIPFNNVMGFSRIVDQIQDKAIEAVR